MTEEWHYRVVDDKDKPRKYRHTGKHILLWDVVHLVVHGSSFGRHRTVEFKCGMEWTSVIPSSLRITDKVVTCLGCLGA